MVAVVVVVVIVMMVMVMVTDAMRILCNVSHGVLELNSAFVLNHARVDNLIIYMTLQLCHQVQEECKLLHPDGDLGE